MALVTGQTAAVGLFVWFGGSLGAASPGKGTAGAGSTGLRSGLTPPLVDPRDRGEVGPSLTPVPPRPWEGLVPPVSGPLVTRTGEGSSRGGGVRPPPGGGSNGGLHKDGRSSRPQGFLAGKTIYLSPGHGWTYDPGDGRFECQRPNSLGLVEDLSNAEAVIQFLIPYLWGASALVVPVREVDMTSSMVVLDDADYADHPEDGLVEDEGDPALFSDSLQAGYGRLEAPLVGNENPFELGGNRLLATAAVQTASVSYVLSVPQSGFYNVYVSYSSWSARASDAHYVVRHPGGEAHFRVDQRHHGGTWVLLGRFWFAAGLDPERGAVVLSNDSADPGTEVSADAVRIGGGLGIIDRGGGTSGWPRYTENSRYHAQYSGAPDSVYDRSGDDRSDDVSARSRFAAWVNEDGEDSAYFSWHTNAGGGTGTSIYIYWPYPHDLCDGTDAVAGSADMADLILAEVVGDLRVDWEPDWTDRGRRCAWFGELNPSNNGEMPSALIEVAFHDLPEDVADLKEPRFRRLVARAVYQGMVRYFAQRDGVTPVFLPEPPEAPVARNAGPGLVEISWRPPAPDLAGGDPPESYRLYQGPNGLAFDEGVDVGDATWVEVVDMEPGEVRFFRVTAVNPGGESLPSPVVGVMASPSGRAPLLIVDGFDRRDGGMLWAQDTGTYLGTVDRMLLERMGNSSGVRRHGPEAAAFSVPFDSAHHTAAAGLLLEEYRMVDYLAGRGVSRSVSITPELRARLLEYLDAGGNLLLSGSHTASDLQAGSAEDQLFLQDALHVSAVSVASEYLVSPLPGELLDGVGDLSLCDGSEGCYDVGATDRLQPGGAGVGILGDSSSEVAGLRSAQPPPGATVVLAFPFEGIVQPDRRRETMGRILSFFEVEPEEAPDAAAPETDADASGDASPICGRNLCATAGCGCSATKVAAENAGGVLGLALLILLMLLSRHRRQQDLCRRRQPKELD